MKRTVIPKIEIGIDIQKVSDFEIMKKLFRDRIFTEEEKEYCSKKTKPAQHFAARFCVKESLIKALSQFGVEVDYKEIELEIKGQKVGITINKRFNNVDLPMRKIANLMEKFVFKVSLSHSGEYAIANAMVIKL